MEETAPGSGCLRLAPGPVFPREHARAGFDERNTAGQRVGQGPTGARSLQAREVWSEEERDEFVLYTAGNPETGNDSFRFKNSSAKAAKPAKEKSRNLTNA